MPGEAVGAVAVCHPVGHLSMPLFGFPDDSMPLSGFPDAADRWPVAINF